MTRFLSLAALLIAACSRESPPAPTAEDSARLNETEDLLNAQAANEQGPEDRSPGPSASK